jgi:hypothetical protein
MRYDLYDKIKLIKEGVGNLLTLNDRELFKLLSRLSTWHYPKKRPKSMVLSKDEIMVYEWLANNNYNPSTVYKWFLAYNNADINRRHMIENGELSFSKAINNSKYKKLSQIEQELLYQFKVSVERYLIR